MASEVVEEWDDSDDESGATMRGTGQEVAGDQIPGGTGGRRDRCRNIACGAEPSGNSSKLE